MSPSRLVSATTLGCVLALGSVIALTSCSKPGALEQRADAGLTDASGGDGDGETGDGGSPPDAATEADALGRGDQPVWEPLGAMLLDCPVERIANAPAVSVFDFVPCEDEPACERMVYAPWVSEKPEVIAGVSLVTSDLEDALPGVVVALGFALPGGDTTVLFARDDGQLLDGYRTSYGSNKCSLGSASVGPNRYGVIMMMDLNPTLRRVGGVLAGFAPAPPVFFEVTPTPPGYGPAPTEMNDARWLWRYYPDTYVTVSVTDGSNPVTFVKYSDPAPGAVLDLTYWPAAIGPMFLFQQVSTPDGIAVESQLAVSDGIQPPEPYLIPPPDTADDKPGYAHTHLGWFRGIHPTGPGVYDKLEIWASPYSADPTMLTPYKVDDYALKSPPLWIAAGHGWFAAHSGQDPPVYGELYAWNLATKARKAFTLPGGRKLRGMIGISPTHVWVTGASGDPAPIDMVARFRLVP